MPRRRADWLIGRIAAKAAVVAALRERGARAWPLRAVEIASEPTGRPYAVVARDGVAIGRFAPGTPLPMAISISHAEGHALGAAAWSGGGGRRHTIGIDLGLVEPRSPAFLATFLTDEERRFVLDGPRSARDLRANLVWCAKEAVLKALGVGLSVDTYGLTCLPDERPGDDAEARPAGEPGAWAAFVATCGPGVVCGGAAIRGLWRALPGGFVGALASRETQERSAAHLDDPGAAPCGR